MEISAVLLDDDDDDEKEEEEGRWKVLQHGEVPGNIHPDRGL